MLELAVYITSIKQIANIDSDISIKLDEIENRIVFSRYPLDKNRGLINNPNFFFSRVYFGNEFCEKTISSYRDIKTVLALTEKKNLEFTFVTPYVTNKGLWKLRKIFDHLGKVKKEIEVVVNDWGVLNLLHRDYRHLKPVLGRLMNSMIRMPRFEKVWPKLNPKQMAYLHSMLLKKENNAKRSGNLWLKLTARQIKALQSCSVSLSSYRRYLSGFNIKRVEFDLVPQGINLDFSRSSLKASIYYPWAYITTGRVCEIGSMHLPAKEKFTLYGDCRKECRDYYAVWKSDWPFMSENIFQKGNTVFMKSNASVEIFKDYLNKGFNRIVYEPVLPF